MNLHFHRPALNSPSEHTEGSASGRRNGNRQGLRPSKFCMAGLLPCFPLSGSTHWYACTLQEIPDLWERRLKRLRESGAPKGTIAPFFLEEFWMKLDPISPRRWPRVEIERRQHQNPLKACFPLILGLQSSEELCLPILVQRAPRSNEKSSGV
jgi:hypothetical protein